MLFVPWGDTRLPMFSYAQSALRAHRTVMIVLLFFMPSLSVDGNSQSASRPASQKGELGRATLSICSFGRGQVFLISTTTTEGEIGWLICVDTDSNHSWLYRLPWVVELQMEQPQSSTSIRLNSEKLPDGSAYVFVGSIAGPKLQGTLTVRPDSSAPDVKNCVIQGHKLSPQPETVSRFPAGRYSNSRYDGESGDAVGAELVLFLAKDQHAGLIKFNESYWGEPEFVPLVLSNIRIISDQKLEFDLKLEDNTVGTYVALRKKGAIILRRLDVPSAPGALPVILSKQPTLLPARTADR
jgi:hypothetical protein